jgi:mitochondrial intermediate peptidase
MVAHTQYHNVSGTRCATDFVELPSILMEHFLDSPQALSIFQPDPTRALPQTDVPKPSPSSALEVYSQIIHAMLDQMYHSPIAFESNFDSSSVLALLETEHDIFPHVSGVSWQAHFGHLFSYGATYYSYLFDQAIASEVWRRVFEKDPLNRENGEKFKQEVLRWGGARDPWQMVSSVLNAPELAEGGSEAMAEVGKWRVANTRSGGRL